MTNSDDENNQFRIPNVSDDSIIADAIAPLPGSIGRERFAVDSRIRATLEVFVDPFEKNPLGVLIHFLKRLLNGF